MAAWLFNEPMFWGACGAFIYAAPKLITCIFEARDGKGHWLHCGLEFIVSMVIGTISAGAFGPWTQRWLGMVGTEDVRVVAVLIGLLANRFAPVIVNVAPDALGERMRRFLQGGPQ